MTNEKWMHISSDMIQAVIFFLGILFAFEKSNPWVVLLLIIAFFLFVTTLNGNSKIADFKDEQKKKEIADFIEWIYGFGFTSLVCAMLIIVYLLAGVWCVLASYVAIIIIMMLYSRKIYHKSILRKGKNLVWLSLETFLIALLVLDHLSVLKWLSVSA